MSLRDEMPAVAAFVVDLRDAFGESEINDIIRRGLNGEAVFHACENANTVGTPLPPIDPAKLVSLADISLGGMPKVETKQPLKSRDRRRA